ncbi:YTH domain-containing protein 1-like [Nannospalax galili]|uniref:YTH domain-containing protein 1-like n=1 Tax=Nannospalax galili TaxID=1026970 RepID=UPI00111C25E8|nr:YTH domain-containing protein 1-like [Nannospalax galili]
MSAIAEQEPGLPDQDTEGIRMGHDSRQIVLHMLPIKEAEDDIHGTAAFLVSQAVERAITEEEGRQEEIWPDVEEIWQVGQMWPDMENIWLDVEEVWPDITEDLHIWNGEQKAGEDQKEDENDQDYSDEEEEEEEENEGEEQDKEDPGEDSEINLHTCKTSNSQDQIPGAQGLRRGKDSPKGSRHSKGRRLKAEEMMDEVRTNKFVLHGLNIFQLLIARNNFIIIGSNPKLFIQSLHIDKFSHL